jgi:hypothetical protein
MMLCMWLSLSQETSCDSMKVEAEGSFEILGETKKKTTLYYNPEDPSLNFHHC